MKNYIYESQITGEIVDNVRDIIKEFISELFKFHIVNWRWKRYSEEDICRND